MRGGRSLPFYFHEDPPNSKEAGKQIIVSKDRRRWRGAIFRQSEGEGEGEEEEEERVTSINQQLSLNRTDHKERRKHIVLTDVTDC